MHVVNAKVNVPRGNNRSGDNDKVWHVGDSPDENLFLDLDFIQFSEDPLRLAIRNG